MAKITTRRKFVAGLATAPAAAIVAVPATATAATSSTLETLLAADTRLSELGAIIDARFLEVKRVSAVVRGQLGKHNQPWRFYTTSARRAYYKQRSLDRYNARRDRMLADHGYAATMAEFKAAEAELDALESDLSRIPAKDPASLVAKARLAKRHLCITHSVIDDMLAYFGSAV